MSSADDYGPETPTFYIFFAEGFLLLLGKNRSVFFGNYEFAYLFEKCQDQRQD